MQIALPDLLEGFKQAHQRFRVAKNDDDSRQMFFTLFESLNWIASIDDRLRDKNPSWQDQFGKKGQIIRALRFVRDRVHHQWADAVYIRPGVSVPVEIPTRLSDWVWIEASQLPVPLEEHFRNPHGKKLYQQLLEDRAVRYSLSEAEAVFEKVIL